MGLREIGDAQHFPGVGQLTERLLPRIAELRASVRECPTEAICRLPGLQAEFSEEMAKIRRGIQREEWRRGGGGHKMAAGTQRLFWIALTTLLGLAFAAGWLTARLATAW